MITMKALTYDGGCGRCSFCRTGGHVANVGVHGRPVTLHLGDLWIKNITITTGQLATRDLVTHHFTLPEVLEADRVFGEAASTEALKVVLTRA